MSITKRTISISGSVVVLKAKDGDQIEWQCDVPFRVVQITKVSDKEATEIDFPRHGDASSQSVYKGPRSTEKGRCIYANPVRCH